MPDTPEHDPWESAVAEVTALSDIYERDLIANDVAAMDAVFWADERVLRFGIAEIQYGYDEIATWRAASPGVPRDRVVTHRSVQAFSDDVVAVDIVFRNGDAPGVGRQSQLWVRLDVGWRIVRAHVSMM
ncbi:MAG: AtzH-like domain-containing protein [Acidimicrobiia bacterium]